MTISPALFSSAIQDWETPKWLFDRLAQEFHFSVDIAASRNNLNCPFFCTKEGLKDFFGNLLDPNDGLTANWTNFQGHIWCNPPYKEVRKWVQKGYEESLRRAKSVFLVPARTDTRWFHDFVLGKAQIIWIKGRLNFSGSANSAPFPSMILIYDQKRTPSPFFAISPPAEARLRKGEKAAKGPETQ